MFSTVAVTTVAVLSEVGAPTAGMPIVGCVSSIRIHIGVPTGYCAITSDAFDTMVAENPVPSTAVSSTAHGCVPFD